MKSKTTTQTRSKRRGKTYVIEFKYGPNRKGPKFCNTCGKRFVAGDAWQLQWDPDHIYAVGVHSKCIVERQNKHAARKVKGKNHES